MSPGPVEPTDLVGTTEIKDRLGIEHPETIHAWRRRYPDFPKPLAHLTIGYIWSWKDVKAWAIRTNRLTTKGTKP